MKNTLVVIIGLIGIIGGFALAAWLGGYMMLYRGIVEAIECPNAGSIIKALFCEAGTIPGLLLVSFLSIWIQPHMDRRSSEYFRKLHRKTEAEDRVKYPERFNSEGRW